MQASSGSSRRAAATLAALAAATALAWAAPGCAPYRPPEGWLAPPDRARADVYGAWIRLRFPHDEPDVDGEFLALGADSVWVLDRDGGVEGVALDRVEKADLYAYDPDLAGGQAWALLGLLGTASNGYYSTFTIPLWSLAAGIGLGSDRRAAAPAVRKRSAWEEARRWARFPQGLPPNLPRTMATRIPVEAKGGG